MTPPPRQATPPIVLAIDDAPANLMVLGAILGEGFDYRVATSGLEALRSVGDILPDVILLDVEMPGIDGYETCRRLKQMEAVKNVPVIFVTASIGQEGHANCLEVGGAGVIEKPVNRKKLLEMVSMCLASES